MSKQIQNCSVTLLCFFPRFDAWPRISRFRSKHFAPKLLVCIGVGMAIKEEEVPVVPPTDPYMVGIVRPALQAMDAATPGDPP